MNLKLYTHGPPHGANVMGKGTGILSVYSAEKRCVVKARQRTNRYIVCGMLSCCSHLNRMCTEQSRKAIELTTKHQDIFSCIYCDVVLELRKRMKRRGCSKCIVFITRVYTYSDMLFVCGCDEGRIVFRHNTRFFSFLK